MFYLASTSPRRKELLKLILKDYKIIKPNFDEHTLDKKIKHYTKISSLNKGLSIINNVSPNDVVFSCDTIVMLNNKILEKPIDIKDAKRMLKELSDNTHEVISGYTIFYKNKKYSKEVKTKVIFNKLSDYKINKYVKEIYVLDKAGAYSIQDDEKYELVKSIIGSYYNVMGLPVESLKKDLIKLKIIK